MKIDILKPILALVAIVFMVLYLHECGNSKDSDLSHNSEISKLREKDKLNQEVQTKQDSISRVLRHSLDSTSKASRKSDSLFKAERIARKQDRRELFALRAASGIRVDTVTLLIEGSFQAQIDADSIQIQKLEARILSDSTNYTGIIHSWVTKFDSEVSTKEAWRIQAVKSTQDAQKYKRQRNKARVAAGVLGAVVALWVIDKVKD